MDKAGCVLHGRVSLKAGDHRQVFQHFAAGNTPSCGRPFACSEKLALQGFAITAGGERLSEGFGPPMEDAILEWGRIPSPKTSRVVLDSRAGAVISPALST